MGAAAFAGAPLACGSGASPPSDDGWQAGDLVHLIPTASHERLHLSASFRRPLESAPELRLGERQVQGTRRDSAGHHYTFDARGLVPDTEYRLRLFASDGAALCADWPLRTFPAPDASPQKLRLLVFTCAGGPENLYNFGFFDAFLPIAQRQRLFARALSFRPDAAVANGDHVYWDLQSSFGWAMGRSPVAWWRAGLFDREQPVLGTPNERVLTRAFGPQIAGLYGVRFRSTPMFFLQDDHDYGENDEADDELRTFPPDPFMLDLARSSQQLYYPALPVVDPTLPAAHRNGDGLAESFGSLRYGQLFEALLYDCRRFLTNALDPALGHCESRFVPEEIERWLVERSERSPCAHLVHMPSTPILWTAGKWGEWYPDFKNVEGILSHRGRKPYWPSGWADQHDRLLRAVSARRDRRAVFVSGDLHALAAGEIHTCNRISLAENPVASVLCGAIGTGALGWPSRFRSQVPVPSGVLQARTWVDPIEENGFSLLDVEPDMLRVSLFRWSPEQGEAAIDSLEPFHVLELPRPG